MLQWWLTIKLCCNALLIGYDRYRDPALVAYVTTVHLYVIIFRDMWVLVEASLKYNSLYGTLLHDSHTKSRLSFKITVGILFEGNILFSSKRFTTYSGIMKVQSPYWYKAYKEVRMTYTCPVSEIEMYCVSMYSVPSDSWEFWLVYWFGRLWCHL